MIPRGPWADPPQPPPGPEGVTGQGGMSGGPASRIVSADSRRHRFPVPIVRDNAIQSIFAATQSVVIVAGSMFTATMMKVRGYDTETAADWHWQLVFVRNWGFTLILIPAAWVLATLWLERHRPDWFSKRWTLVSGTLLLCGLVYFMACTTARAGSSIISLKDDSSAHDRE